VRNAYNISVQEPEGKRPLGTPKRRWRIILEWILRELDRNMWTGCIWLRIGISGELL
jgi:hypothetical protein